MALDFLEAQVGIRSVPRSEALRPPAAREIADRRTLSSVQVEDLAGTP